MGTQIFNSGPEPLVIDGRWGDPDGLIAPGGSFEADDPAAYSADQPGSPWSTDAEAQAALTAPSKDKKSSQAATPAEKPPAVNDPPADNPQEA